MIEYLTTFAIVAASLFALAYALGFFGVVFLGVLIFRMFRRMERRP